MKLALSSIAQKILNWSKRHKVIVLILCLMFSIFCISKIKQAYNILLYGDYKLVARIPIEKNPYSKFNSDIEMSATRIDNDNIIFFIRQKNNLYKISNFNLRKKKYTKNFNTVIDTNYIRFQRLIGNKIYLGYYKKNHITHENYIFAVFDYKTDKIENIKVGETPFGVAEAIFKANDKELILFSKYKNTENSKDIFSLALYNPKNNTFKEISNFEINTNNIFAQLENGNMLSYYKNKHAHIISVIDLEKKKISSTPLDIEASLATYIWLGKNKFMIIYEPIKGERRLKIHTYKITDKNKIEKIASKEIKNHGLFDTFTEFAPRSNIVLNPETILFIGGFNGKIGLVNNTKTTHIYSLKTNTLGRITDFPYRTGKMKFIVLDNLSFLVYGVNKCFWWFGCKGSNEIYKFKLK